MKNKLAVASVAVLAACAVVFAAPTPTTQTPSVAVHWSKSTDGTVTGYRVYYGVVTRVYTNVVEANGINNTSCSISNLVRGVTYHFAATAFTATGLESDYSGEVLYTTTQIPSSPVNLTVTTGTP